MGRETCHCGHVLDEHEATFYQPCTVCECIAYEEADDA